MRILITTTLCLVVSATAISVPPQASIRTKLLVPQGFRPAPAQDRKSDSAELVETAATQARRPIFSDDNYPIQNPNVIPVVQVRPQLHRLQAQGLRRVPVPQQQQQFRSAEEVRIKILKMYILCILCI